MRSRPLPAVLRGITSIVAGSIAGQGLVILSYPLLTRLYDPAEFGLLTVFTSLVGILGVISTRPPSSRPYPSHQTTGKPLTSPGARWRRWQV